MKIPLVDVACNAITIGPRGYQVTFWQRAMSSVSLFEGWGLDHHWDKPCPSKCGGWYVSLHIFGWAVSVTSRWPSWRTNQSFSYHLPRWTWEHNHELYLTRSIKEWWHRRHE